MGGGAETERNRGSEAAAGDDGAVSAQRAGQPTQSSAGKYSQDYKCGNKVKK